ncbi:hypothetical protein LTV02_09730 [Nocardia yamanashiensis]|uniref:hypothetical protein n=1 Tax=Nocardia yamanashiensis TaxID=209247 RepID=UPI001E3DC55C|nr:hypothetical protein [Nocardia yamanashiensis]UGT43635.1 hypothetical protein LTV02_09730 [Nocardia yamanashiensis]
MRHGRRGFLGLAAGLWLVGCIYGFLATPVHPVWPCSSDRYAGEATRLLVLELVIAATLVVAVSATERVRPGEAAECIGAQRISRPLWSLGILWSLFVLIALQVTGIAPFLGYIPILDLSEAQEAALLLMWAATIALGAAAVAHTLAVGEYLTRPRHVVSASRPHPAPALIFGVVIGIALAVPVCVSNWTNPDVCMALDV